MNDFVLMKIVAAYCLVFVMLIQSLLPRAAAELVHSPEVWAHYREHQREEKQSLSFWAFLQMHYSADSKHTKQKKHHLPSYDLSSTIGFFVVPAAASVLFNPKVYCLIVKPSFHWDNSYFFTIVYSLIFPPRN
ncbi:hypothetical protein [Runella sp.]|uniref:hypothetical protein n=1 Tax=Runella sp. TaxID=1960881 RepID=UPI003D119E05